ncbi:MAG: OmpA family protein [Elusimicrobiota bacterium]
MDHKTTRALSAVLTSLVVGAAGCAHASAKNPPQSPPSTASAPSAPQFSVAQAIAPPPADAMLAAEPQVRGAEMTGLSALAPVYFDFDSRALSPASAEVLKKNAEWLKAHEEVVVQVAGRCDQRGTVAYNLALGQLRAAAVRDYYAALGVEGSRVATISYGKEDPVCQDSTEECWSRNRSATTFQALSFDVGGILSKWPETARLAAGLMIEKYGPPRTVSAAALRWRAVKPWKSIVVYRDAALPFEHTVAYAVPADKIGALQKFQHGLIVDADAGTLAARGDSEGNIRLTLNLANEIAAGRMTLEEADRFYAATVQYEASGKTSRYTERLLF